jgi:DNA-binding Lrp family transcriptional regulator
VRCDSGIIVSCAESRLTISGSGVARQGRRRALALDGGSKRQPSATPCGHVSVQYYCVGPSNYGNVVKSPIGDSPILDAIDRRILAELQADGRMTNVELARRAGISAPPCLRRVRRLEEAGVIRGYHTDSDPQKLGWEITFFAIVGLDSQKEAVLSAFEHLVAGWPEVRECHMIRGGGDFLLKLVAKDTAHENQLTQRLTGSPTVTRVQTLQTIRTSRHLAGVPL